MLDKKVTVFLVKEKDNNRMVPKLSGMRKHRGSLHNSHAWLPPELLGFNLREVLGGLLGCRSLGSVGDVWEPLPWPSAGPGIPWHMCSKVPEQGLPSFCGSLPPTWYSCAIWMCVSTEWQSHGTGGGAVTSRKQCLRGVLSEVSSSLRLHFQGGSAGGATHGRPLATQVD